MKKSKKNCLLVGFVSVLTLLGLFLGIYGLQQCDDFTAQYAIPQETVKASVAEDGKYQTRNEVASYIHYYGKLPSNYVTKEEAKAKGWNSTKGNLRDVLPGSSIGGDCFENRELSLPRANNREYAECDINYEGGTRNSERIIYSTDGLIFYTNDHYISFTELVVEE